MPRPSRHQSCPRALDFLRDRYVGDDPDRVAAYERAAANAEVAQMIHDLRTAAGLTQADLAGRVGTARSVISRLEDADYDGHSLAMLRRVAAALGQRLEIAFSPVGDAPRPSRGGRAVEAPPTPRSRATPGASKSGTAGSPRPKAAGGGRRKTARTK